MKNQNDDASCQTLHKPSTTLHTPRLPETPGEPREGDARASEEAGAQNTAPVASGALWAPADADASELARRQRVYAAMSRQPRASKWGRR